MTPPFKNKFYIDKYGQFIKAWKWKDKKGSLKFCTARYENKDGKNVVPFYFDEKENKWINRQPLEKNRPLLNSDIILQNPEKNILLVEGEKCYQEASNLLGDEYIVTTWCGGTGQIKKTDWTLLKNRKVFYWFDHDDPGYKTIDFLRNKITNLIIVQPPIDTPPGWDIADAILKDNWNTDDLLRHINGGTSAENYTPPGLKKPKFVDEIIYPFELLGYNNGYMYFLPHETGQIFQVKQGSINFNHLLNLASLEFWEMFYGENTKGGVRVNWINALDHLIRESHRKGPFEVSHTRGRGAWTEGDEIIIHTGKYIITKNNKILLNNYSPNGHVYERLYELKLNIERKELSGVDIEKIKECFRYLAIDTKLELNCLIGWGVLAPFCSALNWRSHIWLTGSSGTGKSTILEMIVRKMLGAFKICPLSNSTGPGILQMMKNDGLPVVFDEAENATFTRSNIEGILDIARAASSASEEEFLMKGTSDQTGRTYKTNSMFCLSSVNPMLTKKSDKSRFTVINLRKNNMIKWDELSRMIIDTFSAERCSRIRSMIFYNFDTVRESIKNFRNAAGTFLSDMRMGDQLGTLLAGAASLIDMKIYNYDTAYEICGKNLLELKDNNDNLRDEIDCLLKILTSKMRYLNYNEKNEETTLLNLIYLAMKPEPDEIARKTLLKYGIKVDYMKNKIYIACNYEWIKKLLQFTVWENNYSTVLRRLDFVKEETRVVYFDQYFNGRALEIDAKYILRLSDDKIFMEAGF